MRQLKDRIREGQTPTTAMMVQAFYSSSLIERVATVGIDCLIFDYEHFPMNETVLSDLCELSVRYGITPLVRIPHPEAWVAGRVVELGAGGVVIPQCRSVAQMQAVVEGCYYPPVGTRGFNSSAITHRVRGLLTGTRPSSRSNLIDLQHRTTIVVVQVENPELLSELNNRQVSPLVDALLVGTSDLAVAMGEPDRQWTPSDVRSLLRHDTSNSSPALGIPVSKGSATAALEAGFTFLHIGHDVAMFGSGLSVRLQELNLGNLS